ncbi:MAG: helix-turn-helix transcriptional regulator [Syntrophomonadaceae bacterium]|jgi:transcriptional regulator with XRE-family HTH domain|nr:helix-turn-helix transcriptional regulator [Syntrophomonadaceae bacterium]MDD3271511.1 helix-turn-helix transcriptional regulator [Syntrophomonadaceae bacterium]MDD3899359.1 helix-turn-helix transcriptional regulator [Syntrophomonadaceae bacterium]
MKVNCSALMQLAETRNWSIPELAKRLGVNYSYLYRIIRGEKQGGAKLWSGIYVLCKQEGLSIEDYFFMDDK